MTQTGFDFTPRSRTGAPATSKAAANAARFTARSVAYKVLRCLGDGIARTDEEIYRHIGFDPYVSTPRARRADLVHMGLVESQDSKGKSSSGCDAQRWAITDAGLDKLKEFDSKKAGAA